MSLIFQILYDNDIDVLSNIKNQIRRYILDNYWCYKGFIISDKPNNNGLYEVSSDGNIEVINKNITSLTNDLFEWKKVYGYFDCYNCVKLITLEGAPKDVGGNFDCGNCKNLKTLKGAPEYVGGCFYGEYCTNLESLEGAPKEVVGSFLCSYSKNKFSPQYIKKIINVHGKIYSMF